MSSQDSGHYCQEQWNINFKKLNEQCYEIEIIPCITLLESTGQDSLGCQLFTPIEHFILILLFSFLVIPLLWCLQENPETAGLCHHLTIDGSTIFAGMTQITAFRRRMLRPCFIPLKRFMTAFVSFSYKWYSFTLNKRADCQCWTLTEPCAPGK